MTSGAAATTRSKLSSTSSVSDRSARESASASARAPSEPPAARREKPLAISGTTRAGSWSPASETNDTPPAKSARTSSATRIASLVLPVPPGPVSVTSLTSRLSSSSRIAARSASRPTSEVRGVGTAPRLVATPGPRGATSGSIRLARSSASSRVEA